MGRYIERKTTWRGRKWSGNRPSSSRISFRAVAAVAGASSLPADEVLRSAAVSIVRRKQV